MKSSMRLLLVVLALLCGAANAATITVSSAPYLPGTRDLGLAAVVADTDTHVEARFSRENWPTCEGSPCEVVRGWIYGTVNGGSAQLLCGVAAEGGDLFYRNGTLATHTTIKCNLPPGILRTVTVVLENTLQLNTAITIITTAE